jgi:hypothetical protein
MLFATSIESLASSIYFSACFSFKSIISSFQIFAKDDFTKALKSGSKFAKEVIKKMIVIYGRNNFLLNLKRGNDGFKRETS